MARTESAFFKKSYAKKPRIARPTLPDERAILRQMESQQEANSLSRMINEPLENIGPLRNFSPVKNVKLLDITQVLRGILDQMWVKEFPLTANGSNKLSMDVRLKCEQFREKFPPVVSVSQLYGVFPASNTKVDQAIAKLAHEDKLKLLRVKSSSASLDFVIEAADFYDQCDSRCPQLALLCRSRPSATWFTAAELRAEEVNISQAIHEGLLTMDPGNGGVYSLSIPNLAVVVNLLAKCRTWLVTTLTKHNKKFKELPESMIAIKLDGLQKHWTEFYGIKLDWMLYEARGSGCVDGFETPMGRGWRVL